MSSPRSLLRLARRVAAKGLRPLSHRWLTRPRIAHDLRRLGVRPGGILLVHSSLSALGYVPGGPTAVLGALRDVSGPEGTLVFPSHSWEEMEAGGRTFNVTQTRGCVGAIAEAFRHVPGAVRSLHPTHSVAALGPLARELTAGHERAATPCGAGTPYVRALERDCQILFLGIGLEYNTAFHTVEALAKVPYLLYDRPDDFTLVDASEEVHLVPFVRHRARVPRRFGALESLLLGRRLLDKGFVGQASCLLVRGRAFLEYLLPVVLRDPEFLLASAGEEAGAVNRAPSPVLATHSPAP